MKQVKMDVLREAARKLYQENLAVRPGESIVVVSDNGPNKRIAKAAYSTAIELYGKERAEFVEIRDYRKRVDSSPIPEVPESYRYADVIVAPTWKSISHSPETKEAKKNGARIASMPGTREYDFVNALSTDAKAIRDIAKSIENEMRNLDEITITSPKGTNVTLYLDTGKVPLNDDGDLSQPGAAGNIPFGEYAVSPMETKGDGRIVFSLSGETLGDCSIYIKDGKIVDWDDNAKPMVELLKKHGGGDIIAEFAIGTNPAIKYEPDSTHFDPNNTVVNEKIFASCHVAFGNNTIFEGANDSGIHKDVVILEPSFSSKGKRLKLNKILGKTSI